MNRNWLAVEHERTAPVGDIHLSVTLIARPDGFVYGWAVATPLMTLCGESETFTTACKQAEWSADLPVFAPGAWVGCTWENHDGAIVRRVKRVHGKFYGSVHEGGVESVTPVIVTGRLEDAMKATMGLGEERAS